MILDVPEEVQPTAVFEEDVREDQVGRGFFEEFEAFLETRGGAHGMPFGLEKMAQRKADAFLVIYDENHSHTGSGISYSLVNRYAVGQRSGIALVL